MPACLFQQICGDNHSLNFGSTLVDLGDLCITHHTFNFVLSDVTVTTVQLNSLGSNFHSNLSSIQLSHSSFYRVRDLRIGLVLVLLACSLVYQHLGSFHLGSHISQLELCILESGNGLSELLSFLGVSNGSLQSAFCNTQSLGSDTDTSAVQCALRS
jgi:hypothetical protein